MKIYTIFPMMLALSAVFCSVSEAASMSQLLGLPDALMTDEALASDIATRVNNAVEDLTGAGANTSVTPTASVSSPCFAGSQVPTSPISDLLSNLGTLGSSGQSGFGGQNGLGGMGGRGGLGSGPVFVVYNNVVNINVQTTINVDININIDLGRDVASPCCCR